MNAEPASCQGVAINATGVAKLTSAGQQIVFIPKQLIWSVELRFGTPAQKPIIQTLLALALSTMGGYGIYLLMNDGLVVFRWALGMMIFGALGPWLLWEVLQQRFYLEVVVKEGARKLVFRRGAHRDELETFVQGATQLGYPVNPYRGAGPQIL